MDSQQNLDTPRHPVRVASQRTGLSPDVLRVWERRYRAVEPARTPGRQRLYSDRQLERLTLLARATSRGRAISQLTRIELDALRELVASDELAAQKPGTSSPDSNAAHGTGGGAADTTALIAAALAAVKAFDGATLEALLRTEAVRRGTDDTIDLIIAPFITAVGDRWHAGEFTVANEHLATAVVRRVLGWMFAQVSSPTSAPALVVATPSGQQHELGAMLVAAAASTRGWRVVYLGAGVPAEAIADAAATVGAQAVALSLVFPSADPVVAHEVRALHGALPPSVPIIAGGAAAPSYAGALAGGNSRVVRSMGEWRDWLEAGARRIAFTA